MYDSDSADIDERMIYPDVSVWFQAIPHPYRGDNTDPIHRDDDPDSENFAFGNISAQTCARVVEDEEECISVLNGTSLMVKNLLIIIYCST
jgi:hypothetical protein